MLIARPRSLAPLLVYVSLAVLLSADAWISPASRWIGSCCDPEQTMWFLRWIPYAIEHRVDPFVTDQINAPSGVNLMWNSSIPFISLVVSPVSLTMGPIVAYNVAVVASFATSAWCCFIALRRYATSDLAAAVGGAVYGFSPYVVSHGALHLNLIAVWAPPLLLLLFDELLIRRRYSPVALGIAVGSLAACQLLTSEEILATSAVSATILMVVLVIATIRRASDVAPPGRRLASAVLPAGAAFGVLAAWPLAVQFFGPQRITSQVQNLETFSTDLLNLVVPTRYQLFSPAAATNLSDEFSGLFHEATAYVGLPLIVMLVIVSLARWRDLRVRIAASMALTMFILSLGPVLQIGSESTGIPMPWAPLSGLPLLEHALPGRLTLYMWLAIAALVTLGVDRLLAAAPRQAVPGLIAVTTATAFLVPAPMGWTSVEVPPFFERWESQGVADDAIVLVAPYFTNGAGADPMLWAAVAGDAVRMYEAYAYVPLADGKPSYGPPQTHLSEIMTMIQDEGTSIVARGRARDQVSREFVEAGITDVVVGPMRHRSQMVAFMTDLFGRPPLEVDGVELWRGVDRSGVSPIR